MSALFDLPARTMDTAPDATAPEATAGEVGIDLAGAWLTLLPEGVAWWASERVLVVADLHLEHGSSLARRGMLVPPYDTMATLGRLARLIDRLDPSLVISLGDAFHDRFGPERLPVGALDLIARLQAGRDWLWIAGNHDPDLGEAGRATVGGLHAEEIAIGGIAFRHEPCPDGARADGAGETIGEIAGHLHPAARVAVRAKSVRRRCFASDGRRLMLPAFGAYTGGLNILDRAYRGLFDRPRLTATLLGDGRVYPFPSTRLLPD